MNEGKRSVHCLLDAGLGNRLQGLASALVFRDFYNLNLILHWSPNIDCNVTIDDLLVPKNIGLSIFQNDLSIADRYTLIAMNRAQTIDSIDIPIQMKERIQSVIYIDPLCEIQESDLFSHGTPILAPYHYCWPTGLNRGSVERKFEHIAKRDHLNLEIVKRFDEFVFANPELRYSFAIHARRPYSHRDTPPVELVHSADKLADSDYLAMIESILNLNDTVKVFFCSNDLNIEALASREFGSRILRLKKRTTDNNDTSAMHDAWLEMLLMSCCRHVIASSSFSASAALLGGKGYTWIGPGVSREQSLSSVARILAAKFGSV